MAVLDCSRPRLNICCAYQEGRNCKTIRAAYLFFNLSRNGLFAVTAFLLSTAACTFRPTIEYKLMSKRRASRKQHDSSKGMSQRAECFFSHSQVFLLFPNMQESW